MRYTISIIRIACFVTIILCLSSTSSAHNAVFGPRPVKREYDTHHYYALEIRSTHNHIDPREAANALGVELVDRVGELADHWLVRSEKPISIDSTTSVQKRSHLSISEDPVLQRWSLLSRAAATPSLARRASIEDHHLHAARAIRSIERQELRQRYKRDKIISPWDTPHLFPQVRDPIPVPGPNPYPEPLPAPPKIPSGKIVKAKETFSINDPIFPDQWHLINEKKENWDLNVTGVWAQGVTGKGVNVCLIDDGVDHKSPDLKENFFAGGSYDFNAHTDLPEPRLSDDQHGTRCAGEIAAMKNDVCGVGVAYDAHVSGVRILSGPITDVDEAAALNYGYQDNHIYSCSWGPPDDGRSMDAPKGLIAKAILNGAQNGRDGKGSIFVFAGGNGGASDDQCNFDGYTNSIYSMTIAAVDRESLHPYYSEMCSAIIASGWSSGSGDHIHTTDVAWNGVNRCTTSHGGTSAAAPLVAGVIALALEVRPDLTWRDMQHIAVRSAIMINPQDPDWQKTQAGRHFNHKFGYGVIDAYQFVEEARRHTLVKPQAWMEGKNITIPKDESLMTNAGVKSTFEVTEQMLKDANVESLEHVTVRVWITHDRRGDCNIVLTSPHGTKSVLARPRRYDDATTGFPGWGFSTLKHWDESAIGTWTMEVFDRANPDKVGNFWAWSMTLWGSAIDSDKAVAWNFPTDSVEYHETLAAAPATTIIHKPPGQLTKPTDHLPSDHGTAPGESHKGFTNPEADTGYIKGLKKNSTWLFAASGIVLIFVGSMVAFFIIRNRRHRRDAAAEAYEFVPGEDDDDDNLPMGRLESGVINGPGKKRSKRTKELYDAFGEGSSQDDDDDEDDERRLLATRNNQRKTGPYHDDPEEGEETDTRFAIEDENEPKSADPNPQKTKEGNLLFDASHEEEQSSDGNSWQDIHKEG